MFFFVCLLPTHDRSAGAWGKTLAALVDLLDDPPVLEKISFKVPSRLVDPVAPDNPTLRDEVGRAKLFFDFVIELIANRALSQLHHTWCFPHVFARVFVTSETERDESSKFLENMSTVVKSVLAARDNCVYSRSAKHTIHEFVVKLATLEWVITQEMIREGDSENWDVRSTKLRALCWSVFASPAETKQPCENVFGWLTDSNDRQSKTDKISFHTKYTYAMVCPYASTGGINTLTPDTSDYIYMSPEERVAFNEMKLQDATFEELPLEGVTKQQIKKSWRPAGYFSQRVSAMAMCAAFRAVDLDTGTFHVNKIENLWAGCLFVKGQCYFNKNTQKFMLSLGFLGYGCIGLNLKPTQLGEDVTGLCV